MSLYQKLSQELYLHHLLHFCDFNSILVGGEIIHGFSSTLLVGIIVGTYSSVFVLLLCLKWLGFNLKEYKRETGKKEKARMGNEKG